jgi:hypothetical protein
MLQDSVGGCKTAELLINDQYTLPAITQALDSSNVSISLGSLTVFTILMVAITAFQTTRAHAYTLLAELARHNGGAAMTLDAALKSLRKFQPEDSLEQQEAIIQLASALFDGVEKADERFAPVATACLGKLLDSKNATLSMRKKAVALLRKMAATGTHLPSTASMRLHSVIMC